MLLDGRRIAGFIKERQSLQLKLLKKRKVFPTLAIVQVGDDPASNTFVKAKQRYGGDVGINVALHKVESDDVAKTLAKLSRSEYIDGIVLQLPLPPILNVDELVKHIDEDKDVDAMHSKPKYDAPTPLAIKWLLAGYNIELKGKQIAVVGQGRLVGKPLVNMLRKEGHAPRTYDEETSDLKNNLLKADIIISATGQAGLITDAMVKSGTVVIDAGTAESAGKTVGDVELALYERANIMVSPVPGGVGPLTVCALFENVIKAAGER